MTDERMARSRKTIAEFELDGSLMFADMLQTDRGDDVALANRLLKFWVALFPVTSLVHEQHGWELRIHPLKDYTTTVRYFSWATTDTPEHAVIFWTGIYLRESTLNPKKNGIPVRERTHTAYALQKEKAT